MNAQFESKNGNISISPKAIAEVASDASVECSGIVGMAEVSFYQGIVKLLNRKAMTKGVEVDIIDNEIFIKLHIIVAFGVNVHTVADNLIENVVYKIEMFTGLIVKDIKVLIEGIRVID
ncbi:MAG: Asp23/Gls24 family envelope stress response protein [Eubacteriales bacterium]|nr:Asp23/Gls24 family envelope stress response protein [Eubacteriales bacterium]